MRTTMQVDVTIRVSAKPNVTQVTARRKVNVFVLNEIGTGLGGETPTLAIYNDRVCWRVPVILALPLVPSVARAKPARVPDVIPPSRLPPPTSSAGCSQVRSLQAIEYSAITFVPGDLDQVSKGFGPDHQHPRPIDQLGRPRLDAQTHTSLVPFFDDQVHPRGQAQATLHCRGYHDTAHIIQRDFDYLAHFPPYRSLS